jgi:hypothetical protein
MGDYGERGRFESSLLREFFRLMEMMTIEEQLMAI